MYGKVQIAKQTHPHTPTTTSHATRHQSQQQQQQQQHQQQQQQQLQIFTSNVRGIVKNWDKLSQINFDNYDLLLFNEIWQVKDFEQLNIVNFKLATIYQRDNQRGGGVIIFIRDDIKYEVVNSICLQGVIESQSIMINGTLITSLYRPPSGNKNRFAESLTEWIESQRGKQMFIAGDYNLNYLNNEKYIFDNLQNQTGLIPQIKAATRLISNTCIDNVITNIQGKHKVSSICIADHQALESKLWLTTEKVNTKKYKYREMTEHNWNKFSQKLNEITIRGTDINEKWRLLCADIKSTVESSFPEKQSNIKYKFSMSQGLLKSKRKKNELLRKYKRGEIPKENYIRYNKIYRKLIAKEHEEKFKEKLLSSDATSKQKWKVLKTELKLVTKDDGITKIKVDNSEVTNKSDIAKAFKNVCLETSRSSA